MRKFVAVAVALLALTGCRGGDDPESTYRGYAEVYGLDAAAADALSRAVCASDATQVARIVMTEAEPDYTANKQDAQALADSLITLAQDAYCPTAE